MFFRSTAAEQKAGKENGYFDPETNTIYIDINAGINKTKRILQDQVLPTVSHELVHLFAVEDAAGYAALADLVFDGLKEKTRKTRASLIADEVRRIEENDAKRFEGKNEETRRAIAEEEIVARACEDRLANSRLMKEFIAEMDNKESDLAQKFSNFLGEAIARLKKLFQQIASKLSRSAEAESLRQLTDKLEAIQSQFDALLERRNTAIAAENTNIAAENTAPASEQQKNISDRGVMLMSRNESESIKNQIKAAKDIINKMEPVISVKSDGFKGKTKDQIATIIDEKFKSFGRRVDRQNFGIVLLERNQINKALNYLFEPGEKAALLTVPRVIKRGIVVDDHLQHKERSVDSITFAAPVEINGKRGNVGVVVQRDGGTNRFKTLRILLPNGKAFEFAEEKEADSTAGGSPKESTSGGTPIESASADIITNPNESVKRENSPTDKGEMKADRGVMYMSRDGQTKDATQLTEDDFLFLLERAENGELYDNTYIPMRATTPQFFIDVVQAHSEGKYKLLQVPMASKVEHVRQNMEMDEGQSYGNKRPHNLSPYDLLEISKGMGHPAYIVLQKNGRYAMVVSFYNEKHKKTIVSIDFAQEGNKQTRENQKNYKHLQYMNGYQEGYYNIIVTQYDPDNLKKYLSDCEIVYNKKEMNGRYQVGSGRVVTFTHDTPFISISISDPSESVKSENSPTDKGEMKSDRGVMNAERETKQSFEEDKYFARQIDRFKSLKKGGYVTVGKIAKESPLNKIGIPAGTLYFDVSKIIGEMKERNDPIPPETMKKIPSLLNNPIAITEYVDKDGIHSANVYGKLYIGNSPIVIGVMVAKSRNGTFVNKIQTVHPKKGFMKEMTADNILYLSENKKETKEWFQALGAQMPLLGENKLGFIRMLSQSSESVKTKTSATDKGEMKADRATYMTARELLVRAAENAKKQDEQSPLLREYASRVAELDKKYIQLEIAEHKYATSIDDYDDAAKQTTYKNKVDRLTREIYRIERDLSLQEENKVLKAIVQREKAPRDCVELFLCLQILFDFLDHFGVFRIGQVNLSGIHLEGGAVFVAAFIFGNQMHVQVTAGITVSAVVNLLGSKGLVKGICRAANVSHKCVSFLLGNVYDLTDVILVSYDHSAGLGLLLKQDQIGNGKGTDVNAELIQKLAAHAICAILIFHCKISLFVRKEAENLPLFVVFIVKITFCCEAFR